MSTWAMTSPRMTKHDQPPHVAYSNRLLDTVARGDDNARSLKPPHCNNGNSKTSGPKSFSMIIATTIVIGSLHA